jgi:hypothetical protein
VPVTAGDIDWSAGEITMKRALVLSILLAAAMVAPAQAGYSLTGASLGPTPISQKLVIPTSGNTAQLSLALRASFTVDGASALCSTGNLAHYWTPSIATGVIIGYSDSPLTPSVSVRSVVITIYPTALPMASRPLTVVVPHGTCGGSNQTATFWLELVR